MALKPFQTAARDLENTQLKKVNMKLEEIMKERDQKLSILEGLKKEYETINQEHF